MSKLLLDEELDALFFPVFSRDIIKLFFLLSFVILFSLSAFLPSFYLGFDFIFYLSGKISLVSYHASKSSFPFVLRVCALFSILAGFVLVLLTALAEINVRPVKKILLNTSVLSRFLIFILMVLIFLYMVFLYDGLENNTRFVNFDVAMQDSRFLIFIWSSGLMFFIYLVLLHFIFELLSFYKYITRGLKL